MIIALVLLAVALAAVSVTAGVLAWRTRVLAPGPRLTGRTVVIEREGRDAVNIRGVLIGQHADRWTIAEAQAIGPDGDVPLEHSTLHIPARVVLSVSEVKPDGPTAISRR